jgi:hypothetical protein
MLCLVDQLNDPLLEGLGRDQTATPQNRVVNPHLPSSLICRCPVLRSAWQQYVKEMKKPSKHEGAHVHDHLSKGIP